MSVFITTSMIILGLFHVTVAQFCTPHLSDAPRSDADVIIGALMDLSSSSRLKLCDEVNPRSVEELEAFRWALGRIRASGYLQGFSIDVLAYDTCRDVPTAIKAAKTLLMTSHQSYINVDCGNKTQLLLGMLGPSVSSTSAGVVSLLSLSPPNQRLLQLSHSATTTFLTTDDRFSSFFSLAPTNRQQAKVILELLKQRGWNYIGLVTTEDEYGKDGGDMIVSLANQYGICIAIRRTLTGSKPNIDNIRNTLDAVTIAAKAPPKVIVFYGKFGFAKEMMMTAAIRSAAKEMEFVFSDAMQLSQDVFEENKMVSLGSLVIVPAHTTITEYKDYWNHVIRNATEIKRLSAGNPKIEQYFRKIQNCKNNIDIDKCPITTGPTEVDVSLYSYNSILAAYVFASVAKNVIRCQSARCTSDELEKVTPDDILWSMKNMTIDLTQVGNLPNSIPEESRKVTFQNGRTPIEGKDHFDVYSFQKCASTFCFVKVGTYKNERLTLNKQQLKMYDSQLQEIPAKLAVCPHKYECKTCVKTTDETRWLYIPGDLIILASSPIHGPGTDPYTVGKMREEASVQIAESFIYALNMVNKKQGIFGDIFPGKKLGLLIFDSSYSPSVAQKAVYNAFFGGDMNLPNWADISGKVIGVVGGLGSSITKDIANVIMKLKLPQVSFGSTSETLSDRVSYPYFARTCAPDGKQAQLMIGLLVKFNWRIVSLVYIDNSYGQKGSELLHGLAADHNICITQSIPINSNTNSHDVLAKLRVTPFAKVVIMFVTSVPIKKMIDDFTKASTPGEFVYIGSESWGNRGHVIQNAAVAEGSITLIQDFPTIPGFTEEFGKKNPDNVAGTEREWLIPYWQTHMKCSWRGSYDQMEEKICNKSRMITDTDWFYQDPWVPFAVYAFYSLVLGVDAAWKNFECHQNSVMCPELRMNPAKVYAEIKETTFDTMGTGSRSSIYDDKGNGKGGYKVFNVQKSKDGKMLEYKQVGYWADGKLVMNMDQVKFVGLSKGEVVKSEIPNDKVRKECFGDKTTPKPTGGVDGGGTAEDVTLYGRAEFLGPIITLAILLVVVISLIVVVVLCYRKNDQGMRDDYISPTELDLELDTRSATFASGYRTPYIMDGWEKPVECLDPSRGGYNRGYTGDSLDSGHAESNSGDGGHNNYV